MIFKRYSFHMIAAAFLGLAASCSSTEGDQPSPPGEEQAQFSIFTSSMGMHTRAAYPEGPTYDNELIKSWYVAFVRDGEVVAVETGGTGDASSVWSQPLQTILPAGTYTAYAFANIPTTYIENTLGLKEGAKNVNHEVLLKWVYENEDVCFPAETDIPMAGYREIEVRNTITERFAIEVVRLYSRVEFAFVKKNTDEAITIKSIGLQNVNKGNIFLMPKYGEKPIPDGQGPVNDPAIPDDVEYAEAVPTFDPLAVPNDGEGDVSARTHFYVKESLAQEEYGNRFKINLGVERDGFTDNVVAIANEKLKFFYRNDYVLFPMSFSYKPQIKVYDYPPIGGYPVTVENVGPNYYATFSTSGAFDIEASFVNGTNATIASDKPDANGNYVTCTVPEEASEYLTLNYVQGQNGSAGRWEGYYRHYATVQVSIPVTFEFHISQDNGNGELIYTRKLYLISGKKPQPTP